MSAASKSRFVKLDAAGVSLSLTARKWASVLDQDTKLIWMADDVPGGRMTFAKAIEACAAVKLGDFTWRAPSRVELLTLVDDTRHSPAIDTRFFKCQSDWYWTSTPAAYSPGVNAWVVAFSYGSSAWGGQGSGCFARAVRSSQS